MKDTLIQIEKDILSAEPDVALQKALEVASKILGALNQPYQLGTLIYPSTAKN